MEGRVNREAPGPVAELVDRYLASVDAALPGFVRRLYLVGSVALGAWQPPHSDVDTIIVTGRPAGAAELTALAEVHGKLSGRPHLDGVYLAETAFAARPMNREVAPFLVDGELHTDRPCGELTPVIWLLLRRYGIPVRGPAVTGPEPDEAAVRQYNLDNLRDYWQPLAGQIRAYATDQPPGDPVDAAGVAWTILGPPRLHYTLATGDITTKSEAAAYLAAEFPRWTELAGRAARWRTGAAEAFTVADLAAAADAVDAVTDDAWSRWGGTTA
ncbi:nucleotidyltransferase domain-containing protein [Plantactinospora siamensis]|uniref:Nucleotidyltransferase domain-containing protein n=1 Tax=Plantactinospora siamensis TaxID=555372 RepID=A0ABV6NYF5_9ACTN